MAKCRRLRAGAAFFWCDAVKITPQCTGMLPFESGQTGPAAAGGTRGTQSYRIHQISGAAAPVTAPQMRVLRP